MFEKVNPSHPDKIADRIAGALVDLAYKQEHDPRIAVEVLIGHGSCHIIAETSVPLSLQDVTDAVHRIADDDTIAVDYKEVPQDPHLAHNQEGRMRCGDNGIFRGTPVTQEQHWLTMVAQELYALYPTDGKFIKDGDKLIICQSCAPRHELLEYFPKANVNPLGDWTGGLDVDTGATNRKLGSDMGDSVTGGGLCLSGDSEFLSDDFKWHKISEYKAGQLVGQYSEGKLEFVLPSKYIQNAEDQLILFENDSKLSMCLTPYHEVLVRTSKGNLVKHPALLIADSILSNKGRAGEILHTFLYENQCSVSKYADENEYRLQVAFCADGTLLPDGNKRKGRIRVKRPYKIQRMRELLKGKEFTETKDHEYSIFWFTPAVLSKSLYECFADEDWTVLRDEIFRWDGDEELELFRTTKKEDADFIQLVLTSDGHAAGIDVSDRLGEIFKEKYERKSILYTVNRYKSTSTMLGMSKDSNIDVHCLEEKAPSYCFTVPSHNLIIRHNNKIFITGNCGKDLSKADVSVNIYAWIKAQNTKETVELNCAIGDEKVDGLPYSKIVEIARRFIESKGGFEKFAEWGLID